MTWQLTLMITEGSVSTLELACDGEVLIGRLPPAEIELGGATVSRQHCWLRISDAGEISVEDAGSKGGTFVNREQVVGTRPFGPDDELRVGAYTLRLLGAPTRR